MLHYRDTTVFNVNAQTLVNTVNCVGAMGAGLALEFQLRFPEMERDYVQRCKQKKVEVGRPYLYRDYGEPWILNFPTKGHWKYPSKLEWIEQGLEHFSARYQAENITSVAFPKLGCSNGGLEWNIVRPLIEKYLQDLDIDVFICEDTEKNASGTESDMVNMLNGIKTRTWSTELGIRSDIKRKIISALPIYRFRDLRRVEGIGKQTYRDIFSFLYASAGKDDKTVACQAEVENLSLFEESSASYSPYPELLLQSKSEKLGNFSDSANLHSEEPANKSEIQMRIESSPEYDDLFFVVLPSIEKALSVAQTKKEIAEGFGYSENVVNNWLKKAEKHGNITRITGKPIRYIATSTMTAKQLEYIPNA